MKLNRIILTRIFKKNKNNLKIIINMRSFLPVYIIFTILFYKLAYYAASAVVA